jgi:hypothetical protein
VVDVHEQRHGELLTFVRRTGGGDPPATLRAGPFPNRSHSASDT